MSTMPDARPRTSGRAIAALVIGIVGLLIFPLLGIAALFLGRQARAEIAGDPSQGGEGVATAAVVLGWICAVMTAVGLLLLLLLVAV